MLNLSHTRIKILLIAAVVWSQSVCATPIIAEYSGLAGTDRYVDFGADLFPNFTPVSNEFEGITVNPARYFTVTALT